MDPKTVPITSVTGGRGGGGARNGIVVSPSYIVFILGLIWPQSSGKAWDSSEMVSGYQNKQSKPFSDDSMEKYCLTFANFPKMTISAHCARNGIVVSPSYIVCILGLIGPQSSGQAWDSSEMVSGYQNKQSKLFRGPQNNTFWLVKSLF